METSNPTHGIRRFKEISRDRFLSEEEIQRLLIALQSETPSMRILFMLALLTGARKRNLMAMRWEEIDFARETWRIEVTKNGQPLTVPLVPQAVRLLRELQETQCGEAWVFPSSRAQSGHRSDLESAWCRIRARAKVAGVRIHDLRRICGSYQAMTGASLPIIGRSLGHLSQRTTGIYARLDEAPVRESMCRGAERMFGNGHA
ncbi:MAG: site-specific integrase [Magnetococcales bacterium]|nr:site-specific integrase [Magnetococcales bacterium]